MPPPPPLFPHSPRRLPHPAPSFTNHPHAHLFPFSFIIYLFSPCISSLPPFFLRLFFRLLCLLPPPLSHQRPKSALQFSFKCRNGKGRENDGMRTWPAGWSLCESVLLVLFFLLFPVCWFSPPTLTTLHNGLLFFCQLCHCKYTAP